MQRHDRDFIAVLCAVGVRDEGNVLQEGFQAVKLAHGADEFFQVVEPACGLRALVLAPHGRIAAFIKDDFGQLVMAHGLGLLGPAIEIAQEGDEAGAALALDLVGLGHQARRLGHRHLRAARGHGDLLHGRIAHAAFGRVHHALERQII